MNFYKPPRQRKGNRGAALLSLTIALPLVALLLVGLGQLLFNAVDNYRRQAIDDEMVNELQIALGKIVRDLSYAEDVNWQNGDTLAIYTRYREETPAYVTYKLERNSLGFRYLTREGQPLTGGNDAADSLYGWLAGDVDITEFAVKITAPRTAAIALAARNTATNAEYSLYTAVTCLSIAP